MHFATSSHPHRRQPINLVKEDDGRLVALCLLKQQPQLALGLAHPLGQHVGALQRRTEEGSW